MKGVQAAEEAYSRQKRTSNKIFFTFSIFVGHWLIFALLDPDP